ncbi:MAG: ATP-binding protein [Pseudomonadota bacterium]
MGLGKNLVFRMAKAVLSVTLFALLSGGYWFYRVQELRMRETIESNLAETAQLKTDQIVAWREERLGDAGVLQENPFTARSVASFLLDPRDEIAGELLTLFRSLQKQYHYEDILLVDPDGRVALSLSGKQKIHIGYIDALAAALRDRRPAFTDLHTDESHPAPHVSVIAPLLGGNGDAQLPIGAIILMSDASRYLYPLIRSWPTRSKTAETLLVMRDGEDVLFLNDSRQHPDSALKMRIPLNRAEAPEVMAVRGRQGVVTGKDYRGVEVVSVIRPVADSGWFMVVKMDAAEAYAEWRFRSVLILVMLAGLSGIAILSGLAAWQGEKKKHYEAMYQSEAARRTTEEALRQSQEKFRSIVDNIGIGVSLISPEMEILELNQQMRTWFPDIDIDKHPLCYRAFNNPPRDRICDYCPTVRTIEDGRVHEAMTQTPQAGGIRNYRVVSSPILDDAGRVVSAIEMVEDVTEKLILENQIRQAQKMESIGRLVGGVAHDYNNILSVILGYAEMAMEKAGKVHPLRADLEVIFNAAKRSADITRQLLAFARRQTIAPKVLDLNETVEGMLKMLRHLIGEDIDLAWLPETALWPVKMDPTQIDQIMANLCINARDAIAGVGKVTIETDNVSLDTAYCAEHIGFSAGEYVLLAVSDDGGGMDKETLDKIFEPFFTTKEIGRGTGLGLSTVYGIVKQNNGFINVYSEPEKGTTFRIYLPRHSSPVVADLKETVTDIPRGGGETVLVVEDAPLILEMAQKMLERLGYRVLTAGAPGKAIALAGKHAGGIHLLMTDVVMPEMNGLDLAKRLSELYPGLKCLFMSGYTADVITHRGILDESVHFIQKPFSIKALADGIRKALDQR